MLAEVLFGAAIGLRDAVAGEKGGRGRRVIVGVAPIDGLSPPPNVAGVSHIAYIRTYEGWLYLSVVIDAVLSAGR